jgi:UDP-N-acetylmuramyl pentapeptide synthase
MARASGIARPVLVGQSPLADYQATDITPHGLDGTSFSVSAEGRQMAFRTQVPGAHTVAAFLCAIAVARAMNMGWEEIQEAVGRVRLEARQRILRLDPLMIIDDSYNASPLSMNAALELLRAAPGTKIAVLADMLELGPLEEEAHRQVGRRAAEVVDWLVVRGERAAWMAEEARRSGLPSNQILQTDSNAGAAQAVRSLIGPTPYNTGQGADPDGRPSFRQEAAPRCDPSGQWTVLVKGSRGMQLEEVVQALRGEL